MALTAGVAKTVLTPFWGVELAGWGYFLERTWQRIHDDLTAKALVLENDETSLVILSLDLFNVSGEFTANVRKQIHDETGIPPENVLISCTHSHNAPAVSRVLGMGEVDPLYQQWAVQQTVTAALLAWRKRDAAQAVVGSANLPGHLVNRKREGGPVDPKVTVLRIDRHSGQPCAVLVGFQAAASLQTELHPHEVARDFPGEVCDLIESVFPTATAIYLQGACGDTKFDAQYAKLSRCHEPARLVVGTALSALAQATQMDDPLLLASTQMVRLPTRRWRSEEIQLDRDDAQRRVKNNDTRNWRETIGRAMTTRPDDLVARHGGNETQAVLALCRFNLAWTYEMLNDLETRSEWIETEAQILRIGDLFIAGTSAELFASLALEIRNRGNVAHLMFACYANGSTGTLPDAEEIAVQGHAARLAAKIHGQFPFTNESGPALSKGLLELLHQCREQS